MQLFAWIPEHVKHNLLQGAQVFVEGSRAYPSIHMHSPIKIGFVFALQDLHSDLEGP